MSAKDEILARVRGALRDVPSQAAVAEDAPVDWVYGQPVNITDVVGDFVEKVLDYKAAVVQCKPAEVPAEIAKALGVTEVSSAVVPVGLDEAWRQAIADAGVEVTVEQPDAPLSNAELNQIGAVVTAAAVGAAETGTIVLDHSQDQGRRALSLVPDVHICVIRTDQVVSGVPEAVTRLKPSVLAGQPLTWISGGSATSDIELTRVEGVHGPRTLYVIVAG